MSNELECLLRAAVAALGQATALSSRSLEYPLSYLQDFIYCWVLFFFANCILILPWYYREPSGHDHWINPLVSRLEALAKRLWGKPNHPASSPPSGETNGENASSPSP